MCRNDTEMLLGPISSVMNAHFLLQIQFLFTAVNPSLLLLKMLLLPFIKPFSWVQVRKTLDATMQTLQDMLTVEDFDVSDAFQHSRSTESIKSVASESYMSKLNVAKRRSNQQETETFYFSASRI